MSNITIDRTPVVIATEINTIKRHAQTVMLQSAIEIGKRLVEAKELVPHGEWGDWLQHNVDYSKSTANNLMRIAKEFGDKQLSLFGGGKDVQALGEITYTQAVALLGVPDYEREEFVQENDVPNMSTRELEKLIRERDEAKKKEEAALKALDAAETDLDVYREQADEARRERDRLAKDMEALRGQMEEASAAGDDDAAHRLQQDLERAQKALKAAEKAKADLEEQLKAKPIDVPATVIEEKIIERIPDDVARELAQLRVRAHQPEASTRFRVQFDIAKKAFNELLETLAEVQTQDHETYAKFRGATLRLLEMAQNEL